MLLLSRNDVCKQRLMRHVDMSTLMLPAATITTMTNTSPIAVAQPKTDSVKGTLMLNNNNNKQGRRMLITGSCRCDRLQRKYFLFLLSKAYGMAERKSKCQRNSGESQF